MKILKLNILLILLILFKLSSCQSKSKIGSGYDFELFRDTRGYQLAKAVENEDSVAMVKFVKKDSIPVNLQEKKFGNTLLTLAIVNNKLMSIDVLLNLGADPNRRAFDDSSPFLEACLYSAHLLKPEKTLSDLIKYGADVNSNQYDTTYDQFGKRKNFQTTALRTTCIYSNLNAVQILVENGANLNNYPPNEGSILSTDILSRKLDIVKYLMIDKKAPIPDYCVIRQPGTKYEKKMTIVELLNDTDYTASSEQQKLKLEIIRFLEDNHRK